MNHLIDKLLSIVNTVLTSALIIFISTHTHKTQTIYKPCSL